MYEKEKELRRSSTINVYGRDFSSKGIELQDEYNNTNNSDEEFDENLLLSDNFPSEGGNIFDRASWSVGAEYGYSLPIAHRFNIDFSLGVGYMWGKYYEYIPIDDCYVWQATKMRRWFGPTKAEVSFVWLINANIAKGGRK